MLAGIYAASLLLMASPAANRFFDVEATFVPSANARAEGSVDVLFNPLDPDVQVNEHPEVTLRLDAAQVVLVLKPKPSAPPPADDDPSKQRYLDLAKPVRFPVAFAPTAPQGTWDIGATVVYFFCSKRQGWCRRGTADVRVVVTVPR